MVYELTDVGRTSLGPEGHLDPRHRTADGLTVSSSELPRWTAWSGAGLCIANTIGAGVLLSTGFMAQGMGPGPILLAWLLGAVLATLGAIAYGSVAAGVVESGGEYRYLEKLIHPFVGHLAGWGSLVLGFSAPIAVDALAIGAFLRTLVPGAPSPVVTGVAVVLISTFLHGRGRSLSKSVQDRLVAIKLALVVGLLMFGLWMGSWSWPTWAPPKGGADFPTRAIFENQFWIAFAFSGWNAAVYAAAEFRDPKRDVPKAMLIGLLVVSVIYFGLNWVFVANLTPSDAAAVFTYEETRVTLAHVLASRLGGPIASSAVSVLAILVFVSAISAMTVVGPRVYAEMAKDGVLPKALGTAERGSPTLATWLQGGIATLFVLTHGVLEVVTSAAAFLMVFAALAASCVFRIPGSSLGAKAAGAAYGVFVVVILAVGLTWGSWKLWVSLGVILGASIVSQLVRARTTQSG
ncbi:MAG: APC family permease [Deltaproteobacteria bacterium]|nr:APC family permease [Deltaproteobacteria bacterium]